VIGWDMYEGTIVKCDRNSATVQYSGGQGETMSSGTLANIDLKHMYLDDADNAPVPTEH